ncbi:hypothetical protein OC844_005658 [Tilletia horrida]|nr:hypothetical protein OC844_005658 [Tilletia horrida]
MLFKSCFVAWVGMALAVSAVPFESRQDASSSSSGSAGSGSSDASIPFINDDGSIDISSLAAAAAIQPTIVPPPQIKTDIVDIDPDVVAAAVSDQADDQTAESPTVDASDASYKRDLVKRVNPTWQGYSVCGTQLPTSGPLVNNPDTPDAFRADQTLYGISKAAKTPYGFNRNYAGLTAVYETKQANAYLGNLRLQTYDPSICANSCQQDITGCQGFNIYFERTPSINMLGVDLTKCNNPPSITRIGCQFWGTALSIEGATNAGQLRGNYFKTARAGSNAYSIPFSPGPLDGATGPTPLPGKISNKLAVGNLAGVVMFTQNPYADAQFCIDLANKSWGKSWRSFITWQSFRAGVYVGQGCIVYTKAGWTAADATDVGQYGAADKGEKNIYYSSAPTYYYERILQ